MKKLIVLGLLFVGFGLMQAGQSAYYFKQGKKTCPSKCKKHGGWKGNMTHKTYNNPYSPVGTVVPYCVCVDKTEKRFDV